MKAEGKRYRVLRPGFAQREDPAGPVVECEVGQIVTVGDEMAEYCLNLDDPLLEPASSRKRSSKEG